MRHLGLAQQQRAELDAVAAAPERPASPAQPPARDGWAGAEAVVLVQPDRALPGPPVVAELVEQAVGLLARVDAGVEPTEPPCGVGEEVEPFGLGEGVHRRLRPRPRPSSLASRAGARPRVPRRAHRLPSDAMVARSGAARASDRSHHRPARGVVK